jgi:cytochrome c oxidase assembly protein subunit 15
MSQKRSIFEDVSEKHEPVAQAAGGIDRSPKGARRGIRAWLFVLFSMLVVMIVVGGLTRLTDSGLSITEWKPVTGAMPPLSEAAWESEFTKYQEIPEYKLQNKGMSLTEFKSIYWWEWGHRQLGRVIGLVWIVGFVGFLAARQIPTGWTGRLLLLGALGGLQGAIGWWMVSSGLEGTRLDVASYRLAIHLGLAFVILGLIGWNMMLLGRTERDLMQARRGKDAKLYSMSTGLLHVAFIQILLGALVAGIDAGRSYTDWPLMAGSVLPPDMFYMTPVWSNFFENAGLVQFMHRVWGYLLIIFAIVVWRRGRRSAHAMTRGAFNAMMAALALQVILGITTVLYIAPWHLAILHQLLAVVVWVLILRARFLSHYPVSTSIREGQ